jgi:hypothetical protein
MGTCSDCWPDTVAKPWYSLCSGVSVKVILVRSRVLGGGNENALADRERLRRDAPFSLVRPSLAMPQAAERAKALETNPTHLRYMRGLHRVLQHVTILLLSRVRQFTPLQGGPAFFVALFPRVCGRVILRSSAKRSSRKLVRTDSPLSGAHT